ncbi:MAG: S8 family serine peptidase [Bryobacterales bacterium]|nr:S8 family serine peptidase [Bryobacterales bacterium]
MVIVGAANAAGAVGFNPDLNGDGVVNIIDLSTVARCVGRELAVTPTCRVADTNGDNIVDSRDLTYIAASFGKSGFPVFPTPDRVGMHASGALFVKDEVLVKLSSTTPNPDSFVRALAQTTGGLVISGITQGDRLYQIQYVGQGIDLQGRRDILEASQGVAWVAFHYVFDTPPVGAIPNDSVFGGPTLVGWNSSNTNWHLRMIEAPGAWDVSTGSKLASIAIIDLDFDAVHEDLKGNLDGNIRGTPTSHPGHHGTVVAGTACAEGNNSVGISGVAWKCGLRLYDFGRGLTWSHLRVRDAMKWAVDEGSRIVNMSLQFVDTNQCPAPPVTPGTRQYIKDVNSVLSEGIQYAIAGGRDVLWVFIAGNECRDAMYASPASLVTTYPDNVIVVASVSQSGELAATSNFGSIVTVAAPADGIVSTSSGNQYVGHLKGTSLAAPQVAGLASLVLSRYPSLSAKGVKACIVNAADSAGLLITGPVPVSFRVINAAETIGCGTTHRLKVQAIGKGTVDTTDGRVTGCGAIPCVAVYDPIDVRLVATEAPGGVFSHWTGNCSGAEKSISVRMSDPKSCTAVFHDAPACTYSIAPMSTSLPASGGEGSVKVSAPTGCTWIALRSVQWVTITSGTSGSGDGSVKFTVAANTNGMTRNGALAIGGQTFIIEQAGVPCTFSINPTTATMPASGGSGNVSVSAPNGCGWTASSNAGWAIITSGSGGNGNGAVAFTVISNSSTSARIATLTIAGQTFSITQQGASTCTFAIAPESGFHPATGGFGSFNVATQSGCNWTALSSDTWITITSPKDGSGNGVVRFSVAANSGTTARTGTITVGDKQFRISQAGQPCNVSINPDSASQTAGGGIGSFSVSAQAGCNWTASSFEFWITVTAGTPGTGNGVVRFSVAPNFSTVARSGTILVGDKQFRISQAGQPCTVSINPDSAYGLPAGGAIGSFAVTTQAGCTWVAQSDSSWIAIRSARSGIGSGTVRFEVGINSGSTSRIGSISITVGSTSTSFSISQNHR